MQKPYFTPSKEFKALPGYPEHNMASPITSETHTPLCIPWSMNSACERRLYFLFDPMVTSKQIEYLM